MNIFSQIKNSVYGKEYYKSIVLTESLGSSFKYLVKLALIVALLSSIIVAIFLPTLNNKIKTGVSNFVTNYPEDLIVSVKNGNASINRPEPFIVKVPDSLKEDSDLKSTKIDNIMVIDTTKPFSLDTFNGYSTVSLLTKTEMIVRQENNGEMRILPLSKFGNFELTKPWLLDKEITAMRILPWMVFALLPFVYIGIFIGIFVGTMIMSLIYALVVLVIFKIKKGDISYKKSYQVAIHASTAIVIISLLTRYVDFLDHFLVKLLILIIVILLNFKDYLNLEKVIEPAVVNVESEVK